MNTREREAAANSKFHLQLAESMSPDNGGPTTLALVLACVRDGAPEGITPLLEGERASFYAQNPHVRRRQVLPSDLLGRVLLSAYVVRQRQITSGFGKYFEPISDDLKKRAEKLKAGGTKPLDYGEMTKLLKRDFPSEEAGAQVNQ